MKATHFELAANQQAWLDETRRNNLAMGASGLDSLQRFLRAEHRAATLMPERDTWPDRDPDACRVVGTIPIAKVAANFHITAGKSIHHPRGHAHLAHVVPPNELNFSHRIDRLSFSDSEIGGHTLDGDLKVTQDGKMMYQYFIKVSAALVAQEMEERERERVCVCVCVVSVCVLLLISAWSSCLHRCFSCSSLHTCSCTGGSHLDQGGWPGRAFLGQPVQCNGAEQGG